MSTVERHELGIFRFSAQYKKKVIAFVSSLTACSHIMFPLGSIVRIIWLWYNFTPNPNRAGVAELVDARDLKSLGGYPLCGFESRPRHSIPYLTPRH